MTDHVSPTLTCNKCGTSCTTRARSAGTRCKGCGASVSMPVGVRRLNGSAMASAGPRTVEHDETGQLASFAVVVLSLWGPSGENSGSDEARGKTLASDAGYGGIADLGQGRTRH